MEEKDKEKQSLQSKHLLKYISTLIQANTVTKTKQLAKQIVSDLLALKLTHYYDKNTQRADDLQFLTLEGLK